MVSLLQPHSGGRRSMGCCFMTVQIGLLSSFDSDNSSNTRLASKVTDIMPTLAIWSDLTFV